MKYFIAFISISLSAFAQYFLKIGLNKITLKTSNVIGVFQSMLTNLNIWLGLILYGLSMFFWFYVLSKLELSRAYPLVSLGYVFTLFLGYFFLNEAITITKIIAILLIITGVFLINN